MKAGDACASLQAPAAAQVATFKAAGGAMVPVVSTGTREGSTRTDSRGAPAALTLLDVPLYVWGGALRCLGRVAPSGPEQRNNGCSVF